MKTKFWLVAVGVGLMTSVPVLAADHVVPTAPKEYQDMKNPLKDKKEVLEKGQKVYERKCKKCHGATGDGKGDAAEKLTIKPIAFNAPGYMKSKSDGQLFFITEKGSPNTDMEAFGPGTETNLSKDDIWSVITYMRKTFTK